jgi:hypothetical protein
LSFAITSGSAAAGTLVDNKGTISAQGGLVLLTAQTATSVLDNVINTSGIVEATSAANVDGKIVLSASGGGTAVSGLIDASGKGAGETGGTAEVLGDSVTLASGAKIDVSGDAGGGTALVGGNFHGTGPEANAAATTVAAGSIIDADAITSGNGGHVAVWSENSTTLAGSITARGGAQGGNGGFIETSGSALSITGTVDASAVAGHDGTWLLDPADFVICDAGCTMSPASIVTALSSNEVIIEALGSNSVIAGGSLASLGSSSGNIVVSDPIVYSSANQLSLLAGGNITLDATVQNTGIGNINLIAGWDGASGLTGSTFSAAALAAVPNSYGRNGASITIGTASSDVFVSSVGGTTTLAAALIDPPTMVITDPTGSFEVGIDTSGVLFDSSTGIGFRRISDGYDPLEPGVPRDSWGIAYSGPTSGEAQADPTDFGNDSEVTSLVSFAANSATVVNTIGPEALVLTQFYSFAAENVLRIQEAVTNTSGASLAVLFQRDIDWDVAPTGEDEVTTIPSGMSSPVIDASFFGFENPNPSFGYGSSGYPAGGTSGPDDLGGGIKIGLGMLADNATDTFDYYYAISLLGQSQANLVTELSSVGATYSVLTDSSEGPCLTCGTNSAAIAIGPESETTGFGFTPSGGGPSGNNPSGGSLASMSNPPTSAAPVLLTTTPSVPITASSSASASSSPATTGTSAPPAAPSGPESAPSGGSGSGSGGLTSVTDLDPGSALYSEISGGGGSSTAADPIANVAAITPAPQPEPLPLIADLPLGGRGSSLFQASNVAVASTEVAGIDNAPSSGGANEMWFRVRRR